MIVKNPIKWFEVLYENQYGKKFDWENPSSLVDKQRWIMFNTDISKWKLLADKYAVRRVLEEKGYGDTLIPLLGMWQSAEEIDFSNLPNEFVLKTNSGSHDYMIIEDKNQCDIKKIRSFYKECLSKDYGIESCEMQYWGMPKCIIAEKKMTQDGEISSSLIDYKFYTFYGKPEVCAVFFDRQSDSNASTYQLYDLNWNLMDHTKNSCVVSIPRPRNLDRMIEFCNNMCEEFPFVRMDFYEIEGKMYFGEFTFTPCALTPASQVFDKQRMAKWGELMDLSAYAEKRK